MWLSGGGGMVSTALNLGASSPIDVEVQGNPSEAAFDLAKEVRNRIADVNGAADVRLLQRRDAPYLIIDVDRKKAADQGLSAYDVAQQKGLKVAAGTQRRHQAGYIETIKRLHDGAIGDLQQGEAVSLKAATGKADITEVVTAMNNAEMTLQEVTAVRDRVISAYQDILRMPI